MLQFDHVSYTYQPASPVKMTAVRDIDLTIPNGAFVGVIGHTGSGKSTLAQHMNALLAPSSGRVLLDQTDINEKGYDKKQARCRVGLVFQYAETQLFEETVFKDIAFGPKNLGLDEKEIASRVREAMARTGLEFALFAEKSPFELSGGQMRRVAIAGVLAMRPEILVLDEPAAGLDPMGRNELLSMIGKLHEEGTTVVMISHSMDDVARVATDILVLDHGKVAMYGKPEEVFSRAEELSALGLDVPQACALSMKLRAAGLDFPICYKTEDALEALKNLLKGGNAKC